MCVIDDDLTTVASSGDCTNNCVVSSDRATGNQVSVPHPTY